MRKYDHESITTTTATTTNIIIMTIIIIIINGGGPKNNPGKNSVSKQNLSYNAVRFKNELEMNAGS